MFLAVTVELVSLAAFSGSTVVPLAFLVLAVSSIAGSSFDAWGATEIRHSAPPGLMGRYNSVIFIALDASMFVGALIGGSGDGKFCTGDAAWKPRARPCSSGRRRVDLGRSPQKLAPHREDAA